MMVEWLFLAVPWGCLRFVIVVFPDHTHILFLKSTYLQCKAVLLKDLNADFSLCTGCCKTLGFLMSEGFTDIKKPNVLHHPMQAKNLHFNPYILYHQSNMPYNLTPSPAC